MSCEIMTVVNLCGIPTNKASKQLKLFKQSFEAFTTDIHTVYIQLQLEIQLGTPQT